MTSKDEFSRDRAAIRCARATMLLYSLASSRTTDTAGEDKQWEAVDEGWMSCLRDEKPENILLIPSGGVQMLKDVGMAPLSTVLSQGMNLKKKHEVEVLSSVVSSVVNIV